MKEYSISTLKYIQTKKTKTVKNCRFESEELKNPQLQNGRVIIDAAPPPKIWTQNPPGGDVTVNGLFSALLAQLVVTMSDKDQVRGSNPDRCIIFQILKT